ncbi:hypothetical protein [Nocardia asiatica]|uniref:hypothetical protein n=1 Tax=Nocardia asiatica TaxID=209252 RepID=UPI0024581A08|nr:hypothetical protein [Nocardia asiatica]
MDSNITPNQPIDIEVALSVYLKGVQSGIAIGARNVKPADYSRERAEALATQMLASMESDPAVLETMRDQIRAHFAGASAGPKGLKLRNWRDASGQ